MGSFYNYKYVYSYSVGIDFKRQNLHWNVDPCTERTQIFIMAIDQ